MSSSPSSHRWVATLIVLLLLAQAGNWAWHKYRQFQQEPSFDSGALKRKIAASMAYEMALQHADSLLNTADTVAAGQLLDSLRRAPADSLFPIEHQKLRKLQQRLSQLRQLARNQAAAD